MAICCLCGSDVHIKESQTNTNNTERMNDRKKPVILKNKPLHKLLCTFEAIWNKGSRKMLFVIQHFKTVVLNVMADLTLKQAYTDGLGFMGWMRDVLHCTASGVNSLYHCNNKLSGL